MGPKLDTTALFSQKFNIIEYGTAHHHTTWQYLKGQMRGFNPAVIMDIAFKL